MRFCRLRCLPSRVPISPGSICWSVTGSCPRAVLGRPPNELDALQQRSGVGPCIDAARSQQLIRVDDLRDAKNWPEYGALAISLGVQSMVCTPMRVDDQRSGSISLFSTSLAAFGPVAERLAGLLGPARSCRAVRCTSPREPDDRATQPRHHRPGQGRPDGTSSHHRRGPRSTSCHKARSAAIASLPSSPNRSRPPGFWARRASARERSAEASAGTRAGEDRQQRGGAGVGQHVLERDR